MVGEYGSLISLHACLSNLALIFFQNLFQELEFPRIGAQLKVIRVFPRIFDNESIEVLKKLVTKKEFFLVLKKSRKEKSPGRDAWKTKFYLEFFDLLAQDLVRFIEDIRVGGRIFGVLNATFISLISKKTNPQSFREFHPISLCNLLYKLN